MPKIEPSLVDLAKSRKYVLIDRVELAASDNNEDVAKGGYIKDGFKNTKMLTVKTSFSRDYLKAPPDWFEASIAYLDSTPVTTPSKPLTALADETAAVAPAPPPVAPGMARGNERPSNPAATPTTPAKEAPATKPAPPPIVVPPVSEADQNEEKATKALNLAKSYYAAGQNQMAKTRFEKIIQQYPKTAAAKDAKLLIDQINQQQ